MAKYLGICELFDKPPMGAVYSGLFGAGGAAALNTAFNAVAGRPDIFHNTHVLTIIGIAGVLAAAIAHDIVSARLSKHKVGLSKGTSIVRKTQAIVYGLPVAAALTFNAVSDIDIKNDILRPLFSARTERSLPERPAPVPQPSQFLLS